MTTQSTARKKTPSVRQLQAELAVATGNLETARQRLETTETLLGEAEERRVELEDFLESAQYAVSEERRHSASQIANAADTAVVLAYLAMPTGTLPQLLAKFQEVAVRLGIGPEVKRAATEAITSASAAFAAGEWPDDKLRERAMAEGVGDPMDLLGVLSRLDPRGFGPLEDILGGGMRDDPFAARR